MKKQYMFRQGDVLLVKIPRQNVTDAMKEEKQGVKAVLALGEATGHHHRVEHPGANIYAVNENLRLLRIEEDADLIHEEHSRIALSKGDYQIIIQKENSPLGWRRVVD